MTYHSKEALRTCAELVGCPWFGSNASQDCQFAAAETVALSVGDSACKSASWKWSPANLDPV